MRIPSCFPLFILLAWLPAAALADETVPAQPAPVVLEFGGYRFGQSPSANMTCFSGYCKSQVPGGDGRVTVPFSIYETPGAVSTLSSLMVVNPRYTFWEDRLFRIVFQVDCTPLDTLSCLDEIVKTLDREYVLKPLSSSDVSNFVEDKRLIVKEFRTDSGAFVKVNGFMQHGKPLKPWVDIVDRGMANLVGSTLSPTYKPKKLELMEFQRKP